MAVDSPAKRRACPSYVDVTEISGDEVSREQLARAIQRYGWAREFCRGRITAELACGAGFGLGLLDEVAAGLIGLDIDPQLAGRANSTYRGRVPVVVADGVRLPLKSRAIEVLLLFEAIYYFPNAAAFFREAARVVRPGGHLLVVSANRDLFDFVPSPYSVAYYNAPELAALARAAGFEPEFHVGFPVAKANLAQRVLRPAKKLAAASGLFPKTMAGKKLLKRLVFGRLVPMPADLRAASDVPYEPPEPWPEAPNRSHKVLFMAARRLDT